MTTAVAGIDACPKGWVAVALARSEPHVAADRQLGRLIDRLEPLEVIAIDMPIGLPETVRECDRLAQKRVKPRHSSVFPTPPAVVLAEPSFELANQRARELLGRGVSRQSWALRDSIQLVGRLADKDARIVEVHPEVSFRALTGAPVEHPKTSWNGQAMRRRALADAGIPLPDMLVEEAASVPPADVLDAAAAAWSARRYASGEAHALPQSAQRGRRQVIWY